MACGDFDCYTQVRNSNPLSSQLGQFGGGQIYQLQTISTFFLFENYISGLTQQEQQMHCTLYIHPEECQCHSDMVSQLWKGKNRKRQSIKSGSTITDSASISQILIRQHSPACDSKVVSKTIVSPAGLSDG